MKRSTPKKFDNELKPPLQADYERLKALADATRDQGGEFYELNKLGDLLDKVKSAENPAPQIKENEPIEIMNAHRPMLLAIIMVLLAAEWMIRKRSSLV